MTTRIAGDDYVLGTGDDEIARLELQHVVWRPRATDAWRRAGFTRGMHLVDVGCGPGHATFELAAVAGPSGGVTAIDRSPRFLEALQRRAGALRAETVRTTCVDLDTDDLPRLGADGAWCRWVLCFVRHPRRVLAGLREMLRPRGVLVLHEYFDYGAWRLAPRSPDFEEFVAATMRSWRDAGGEPDVALDLLPWLGEEGFEVVELRPIVDIVSPRDFVWQWPSSFVDSNLRRLAQLGQLTPERAAELSASFHAAARSPHVRMVTPALLEIIAVRR